MATRAALSVMDTMHGMIVSLAPGRAGTPSRATVRVTGTGKVISGVVYARPFQASDVASIVGTSVTVTRVGGRLVVL